MGCSVVEEEEEEIDLRITDQDQAEEGVEDAEVGTSPIISFKARVT